MKVHRELVFRQRFCRAFSCGAVFWICRSCDRGQRYCSESCRSRTRLQQRRAANRRHQQSPEGRLDHRDRQRAYRARLKGRVTDHSRRSRKLYRMIHLFSPDHYRVRASQEVMHARKRVPIQRFQPVCRICGRFGLWVEAFCDGR
jgi:hypothetical protein